jgi:hypothetical protein
MENVQSPESRAAALYKTDQQTPMTVVVCAMVKRNAQQR